MGILQLVILSVLVLLAVIFGNVISHRMIKKYEEKKAKEDLSDGLLQVLASQAQPQN